MENVNKIDIIVNTIYCYDEFNIQIANYPLTKEYDFFMNEFSDTQELLTVNISDPIARIMKFYTIENSVPKSFVELNYIDMTREQKAIFDTFVEMIKSK